MENNGVRLVKRLFGVYKETIKKKKILNKYFLNMFFNIKFQETACYYNNNLKLSSKFISYLIFIVSLQYCCRQNICAPIARSLKIIIAGTYLHVTLIMHTES
jgi:hypothetical protein